MPTDNVYLRYASALSLDELVDAHRMTNADLLKAAKEPTGYGLDVDVVSGSARGATCCKCCHLTCGNLDRIGSIVSSVGAFQLIFGGKVQACEQGGKRMIGMVHGAAQ